VIHSRAERSSISGRNGIAVARESGIVGPLQWLSVRVRLPRVRGAVMKALALAPRGFVRRDVLVLNAVSARLKLEWRTRDIHPWDRGLSSERRNARFRDQALQDTDAAIVRCFRLLPEVDEIDVRVLGPGSSDAVILAGTVARCDVAAVRGIASPRMRLELMGIRYLPLNPRARGAGGR